MTRLVNAGKRLAMEAHRLMKGGIPFPTIILQKASEKSLQLLSLTLPQERYWVIMS